MRDSPANERLSEGGLQAVLLVPREPALVAELPAVVRTAHRLASEEGVGRVLLVDAPDGFLAAWRRVLEKLPVREISKEELRRQISPDSSVLVVASDGMPVGDGLTKFCEEARRERAPAAWTWKGRVVCAFLPEARPITRTSRFPLSPEAALQSVEARGILATDESWAGLEGAEQIAKAEERLYAGLSHGRDGYLSQFDRRISIAFSRRLFRTSVTPNQITAASIVLGLVGAALVASADFATCLAGTLLAWLSSILDGCDGEIARLKLLFSEAGRRFDLFGDYLVNCSLIAAIGWHVHRTRPDLSLGPLALILATGVAMSGLSAWWLFLRQPQRRPAGFQRTLQRLASRDFIYVVIPLAALGRLEWFLYGAAFGSQLFWIALAAVSAKLRLADDRTPPASL